MKKRCYAPIITFAIGLLLLGGIAYAADKRKHNKLADHEPKEISEEEALKKELLAPIADKQNPSANASSSKKAVHNMPVEGDPSILNQITYPNIK
jgi:hypothetical protein